MSASTVQVTLVPIPIEGLPPSPELPPDAQDAIRLTIEHYGRVGFARPWICYLGFDGEVCVGMCGFKGAPAENRVELSYGTVEGHRRKGYATAMTLEMIRLAREAAPTVIIAAQTLPENSPSTRLLQKLGFHRHSELIHPEDGLVWEWRL